MKSEDKKIMIKKNKQPLFDTYMTGNEKEFARERQRVILDYAKAGYRLVDSSVVRTRQGHKYRSLTFVYDESYCTWISHGSGLTSEDWKASADEANENLLVSNKARYHEGYCVVIEKGKENAKQAALAIEHICLSKEGFWNYYFEDLSKSLDNIEKYLKKHDYITFPDFGGYMCKHLVEELTKRGVKCKIMGFFGENYIAQCSLIHATDDVLTNSFSLENFNQIKKREYLENKFNEAGQAREGDKDQLHVFSFVK